MSQSAVSLAQHYHQRTKYDPDTLASRQRQIDWAAQPRPYKDYPLGTVIDLQPYLQSQPQPQTPESMWWQRLSRLLINSYGLTARVPAGNGQALYLRAAPSAGGLYPAEIYLISRGTSQLKAGLYNYQVRSHGLLRVWEDHVWQKLQAACFWHPALEKTQLALVVTAVFGRSVWRYEDRAYRRVLLDSGHLLGNVALASALSDYRPHLIGGFADQAVNQLLYLDPDQEGGIAIAALADLLEIDQNLPHTCTALPSPTCTDFPSQPADGLLSSLHRASAIPPEADYLLRQGQLQPRPDSPYASPTVESYRFSFGNKVSTATGPIPWGEGLQRLEDTILKRRSTRRYTGAPLTQGELTALLDFTYQPHHYVEQGLDSCPDYFDLSLIQTFVAISAVPGLEAGCYHYAPAKQELRQIRFKAFRKQLHYLCLGQDLGRDAAALVFHTADLNRAISHYGDRAYRYLHMDAGHLGQRLNLAATRIEVGVSGIAGFFDDQVNDVLGIPPSQAVLYITTLGRPARGA